MQEFRREFGVSREKGCAGWITRDGASRVSDRLMAQEGLGVGVGTGLIQ